MKSKKRRNKKNIGYGVLIAILIIAIVVVLYIAMQKPAEKPSEAFCGSSTEGRCSGNSDCKVGGCSGQVCQSKQEANIITTCEWRNCYNASAYNLECKCINGKCKWR